MLKPNNITNIEMYLIFVIDHKLMSINYRVHRILDIYDNLLEVIISATND